VLWLLSGDGEQCLRLAAHRAGVDPQRLVFASKLPHAHYLARYRLADLFLDTRLYNAHTTASGALWAGLPVLTCVGTSFAGRVGASLLAAIGLSGLTTRDLPEYVERAVELATSPARLEAIRAALAANRLATPLFDTASSARALEQAYERMWEIHASGKPPRPIALAQRG
jgi:predicted O-linked N-acetylglucosamine transferase (SPINDLY family)